MTTSKKKLQEASEKDLIPPAEAAQVAAVAEVAAAPEPQQVNLQIHLRKIPLLSQLSDEEMQRVKSDLRIRQYAKRDIVLQKGAPGDSLLFLLTGSLQVIDITED